MLCYFYFQMDFKLNPFSDNNCRIELPTSAVFGIVLAIYVVYEMLKLSFDVQWCGLFRDSGLLLGQLVPWSAGSTPVSVWISCIKVSWVLQTEVTFPFATWMYPLNNESTEWKWRKRVMLIYPGKDFFFFFSHRILAQELSLKSEAL